MQSLINKISSGMPRSVEKSEFEPANYLKAFLKRQEASQEPDLPAPPDPSMSPKLPPSAKEISA